MMGLEPTASGATIQRSNQLSYIRHNLNENKSSDATILALFNRCS